MAHFNAGVHLGRILDPPMVGEMIDRVGIGPALAVNAVFYVISVLFLWRIRTPLTSRGTERQHPVRNFLDGLSIIRNTPVLLTVIVVTCSFGGFGTSHLQVVPAFAKEQLGAMPATRPL